MKLRSGKVIGDKPVLSLGMKTELKNTLQKIKNILKDHPEFFSIVIEKSLLLGKEVDGHVIYRDTINKLIWDEYPDLNKYEDGPKLLTAVYKLGQLITIQCPSIRNKIIYKSENYFSELRDLITEEVHNILPTFKEAAEAEITGECHQQGSDFEI